MTDDDANFLEELEDKLRSHARPLNTSFLRNLLKHSEESEISYIPSEMEDIPSTRDAEMLANAFMLMRRLIRIINESEAAKLSIEKECMSNARRLSDIEKALSTFMHAHFAE